MEGEKNRPSAGFQTIRQHPQQAVQSGEFLVDRDSNRLEHPPQRQLHHLLAAPAYAVAHRRRQRQGVGKTPAGQRQRQLRRPRLVGMVVQRGFQLGRRHLGQPLGGAEAAAGIHPHVERTRRLETEAAGRIVQLHRGTPKVGKHDIHPVQSALGEHLGQARVVATQRFKRALTIPQRPQPGQGFGHFQRIQIQA